MTRPPGIDPAPYRNLPRHSADGLLRPAVQRAVARKRETLAALGR